MIDQDKIAQVQEAMRLHGMPDLADSLPECWPHYNEPTREAIVRNWLGDHLRPITEQEGD